MAPGDGAPPGPGPAPQGDRVPGRGPGQQPSGTGETDVDAVARLLGRRPDGAFTVVVRTPAGAPAVIENEPWLDDGTPMPTRFWLVDPDLRAAVSRLESAGGVRRAAAEVDAQAVAAAHRRYAAERQAIADRIVGRRASGAAAGSGEAVPGQAGSGQAVPGQAGSGEGATRPWPSGGVGGTRQGVKCLHAHLAWHLAGGDDPVGAWTAVQLGVDRAHYRRVAAAPLRSE